MSDESILVQEGDDLMDHYLTYTEKTVAELHVLAAQLAGDDNAAALSEEMHALAHNIRGMGSSFGFPLMTRVGTTLCTYLRALDEGQQAEAGVVSAHLKAMDTILENRILGDGGGEGQALIAHLEGITSG